MSEGVDNWKSAAHCLHILNSAPNDAGSADEAETVEESILHAKQAVSLDIKDGQSWCTILFHDS